MKRKALYALSIAVFLTLLCACSQDVQVGRVPSEVQEVITRIGEQISQERYDQIYNESSGRWKQEVTLTSRTRYLRLYERSSEKWNHVR